MQSGRYIGSEVKDGPGLVEWFAHARYIDPLPRLKGQKRYPEDRYITAVRVRYNCEREEGGIVVCEGQE